MASATWLARSRLARESVHDSRAAREVADGPRREAGEAGGGPAREVVVGVGELVGAARVCGGAGHVAARLRDGGAIGEDHAGDGADDGGVRPGVSHERLLGGVEVRLDAGEVAADHVRADVVDGEFWARADYVGGEGVEPGANRRLLAVAEHDGRDLLDEFAGVRWVVGEHCVADGVGEVVVGLVPLACAAVELCDGVGRLGAQPRGEHVGEEVVVPIPATLIVERHHEEVGALERLEHRGAVGVAGDGVAQRAGQAGEDRGLLQEAPDVLGLPLQHLFHEVVDDEPVVAGEGLDESGGVLAALERQRGKLEGDDPALGARLERLDVCGGEGEPHGLGEVGRGLLGREAQVGGADLDELAPRAQPGERQARIGPRADHDLQVRWQVVDEEGEPVLHLGGVDDVVVVEDQDQFGSGGLEVRGEAADDRLGVARTRGERLVVAASRVPASPLERGDHVTPEHGGIVVALDRARANASRTAVFHTRYPVGEEGRLAEPGWCRDESELRLATGVQALDEARPRDESGSRGRDVELGGEKRTRHGHTSRR